MEIVAMKILKILHSRPQMFFRLSGIRVSDFEILVEQMVPLWEKSEHRRLSSRKRQRNIGAGMKYHLEFSEQLLLCLIYYRTYTSQVFMGLLFDVSSPTVCRRVQAMTVLLAGYFRMPERSVDLSKEEEDDLLYLMVDGTERPVQRPKKSGRRKETYSGKKKRHTAKHQIITDNNKRILAVGPAQKGSKHDKKIFDESKIIKPPNMTGLIVLGDSGYLGTDLEIPIKKQKNKEMQQEDKDYNKWHSNLRVGVEHAIGRMKKFNIFAYINRGNRLENLIAKNIAGLANINLKIA
jgi:hypothetical protein